MTLHHEIIGFRRFEEIYHLDLHGLIIPEKIIPGLYYP
jgi:hypothetical protein